MKMTNVVKQARKQINIWILILTVVGITLLTFYTLALIPSVTGKLITLTLLCALIPTATMVAIHEVLMIKRWKLAANFLGEGEGSGTEVSAEEAFTAIMDFPVKMPMFGFAAWAVGGLGAVFGAYVSTDFKLPITDALTLYIGILSGATIITIFQFYQWRSIIDPVAGLIIHRAPALLDSEIKIMRTPLQRSLFFTLIPLIILSLFMAEMAGYRQAATTLQNWVGLSHLDDVRNMANQIEWERLSESTYKDQVRDTLTSKHNDELTTYLLEIRENGAWELVRDIPYKELFPSIVIDVLEEGIEDSQDGTSYQYNNFGPEISVAKKVIVGGGNDKKEYILVFGYPWKNYSSSLNTFILISIILMLGMIAISIGVVKVISRDLSAPVSRLIEFTEEMGSGKIHSDVFFHANDEVGDLALSLRRMSGRLGEVLHRIQEAAKSLELATGSIRKAGDSVKEGATLQEETIDDVASAMSQMNMNIQGIADNVEVLSSSAEESSSSIFEMSAAIKRINESVGTVNQSIDDVSSSINETASSLDQVAENVGNLSAVSEETSASMAQMDASIREVEQSSKDAAEWSESVIQDAEAGVNSVSRVSMEMNEISEVVLSAQQVIERLGTRVEEIGKIVKVIDDVANQTNLLALNAAIIAAQAGEHGRGFAVVADEIKQLAERTSGSTREIHQLIRGVQDESRQAVGAVEEGARAVEEGVKLSEQASGSLAKILENTKLATERVQGIAKTTIEQAESSRQVSQAIERIAEMVNQISMATRQQSQGGSLILKATEEMKTSSLQVKRNAEEQLQGSRLLTKSIENITDMLYSINQSQQEQKRSSTQVVQLMERIKVVSQESTDNARQLDEVLNVLTKEEDTLREEMRKFQLSANHNGPGKNAS